MASRLVTNGPATRYCPTSHLFDSRRHLPPAFIQSASAFGALGGLAEGVAPLFAGDAKGGGAVGGVAASGPPGVELSLLLLGALAPSIAPPPVTPGQAPAIELAAMVKMAIKQLRIHFLIDSLLRRSLCYLMVAARFAPLARRDLGRAQLKTLALALLVSCRRARMSSAAPVSCPRCGSTELELETASLNGETADETTVQTCRRCGYRFSITAKRD
jgi:hypothetical protein